MTKAEESDSTPPSNDNSLWSTAFYRTSAATVITTDTSESDTRIQIIGKLPEELLSGLLGDFLSLDEKRALAELPVKNPSDELKHISNTFKDRLTIKDKPKALTDKLLAHVARGEQDEADKLLMHYGRFQDISLFTFKPMQTVLLQRTGIITDYSGRTFKNITAYEYAYWAKDTHMCRMLEKHMDEDTKADMLTRCEAIEKDGLTYEQHGHVVKNSKHFDMTPLIMAYNEYNPIYNSWDWNNKIVEAAVVSAWMAVGMAQRDVPVHVINEYFRTDRTFNPLPEFKFKGDTLPRETKCHDYTVDKAVTLFPLVSGPGSLGVDFALASPARRGIHAAALPHVGPGTLYELAAISRLDVVRTQELKQSLEFLGKPKEPERSIGPR